MELCTALFDAIKRDVSIVIFKDILGNAGNECSQFEKPLGDISEEPMLTPLAYACKLIRTDIVKVLLDVATEDDKRNSFWYALNHDEGNLEIVKKFVQNGVDVNIVFHHQRVTPLLLTIDNENEEIMHYLIDNGADINYLRDRVDIYPFELALVSYASGKDNMLKHLIKYGLDVNENDGETLCEVFKYSTEPRWKCIFELCLDHGANLELQPFMYHAVKNNDIGMVRCMIEHGLEARHECRYNGHLALHVARGHSEKDKNIVEELLDWGADPNSQVTPIGEDLYDTFLVGFSALHYACSQADLEKLTTLLDYGADVHLVNCSNVSVLFQLLDAICKDKSLYEYMVFSSNHILGNGIRENDMISVERKAVKRFKHYSKMAKLLLASGATLLNSEFMISYKAPYVVMSGDILDNEVSSPFLSSVRLLIDNIKGTLQNPMSLQDLCRVRIRSVLPNKKSRFINKVSDYFPKHMVSYLLFKDI